MLRAAAPPEALILKASNGAETPIVPLSVIAPLPLLIVRLSVPPAPTIVLEKANVPSSLVPEPVVTSVSTVTSPLMTVAPVIANVPVSLPEPPP